MSPFMPGCLGRATDAGDVSNFRIGIRYAIRYFALVSEHRCCCAQARFMPNLQSLLAQDKSEVMGTRVALVRPKVDYSLNCVPLWIGQGQRRLLRVRGGVRSVSFVLGKTTSFLLGSYVV